jgi:hypothetical protein
MYAHKKSVAAGAPWWACQHSPRMLTRPSKHKTKPKCVLLLLPKITIYKYEVSFSDHRRKQTINVNACFCHALKMKKRVKKT